MRKIADVAPLMFTLSLALSVTGGVSGCKKRGAAELPPAQGKGAAPMPELPSVAPPKTEESATVAATEGHTTGTTFPRAEAQVGVNASGVIQRIFVKEGDKVRKGMVLFRQDTGDAALRVAQAQASLEAARVNLKATETEHARTKAMFDAKAVNGMQWDQMVARLDGARVQVQQAEVALSMARKAQGDATVRSPLDGVVVTKLKNEGEMATMMPPTVVLLIQDQSMLELRFRLAEKALAEVAVGDPVTAKFAALNITREAKVARVQPAVDARTRTIEVVAELPNKDGALRSGLLAEVSLTSKPTAAAEPAPAAEAEAPAAKRPAAPGPRAGRPAPKPESQPQ